MAKQTLYPTIAVSDGFMGSCCAYAAHQVRDSEAVASCGLVIVACACYFGVLRFGFAPGTFAKYNEAFARAAGSIGVPLLCLAFARKIPAVQAQIALSDLDVMVGLLAGFLFVQQTRNLVELYETMLNAGGMVAAGYAGSGYVVTWLILFSHTSVSIPPDRFLNKTYFFVQVM